jgi:hypothetical protein
MPEKKSALGFFNGKKVFTMKHILVIFFTLFILASLGAGKSYSISKESDSGAMLTMQAPESDTRVYRLRTFLEHYHSPVAPYAHVFVDEADRNNLDWKFVASIAGLESTFCRNIPTESYNCWGWGIPTGAQSGIAFDTFTHGIQTVSQGLRSAYIDHGLLTVEQIGAVYAASPTWATRVRLLMDSLDRWEPPIETHALPITI